MSTLVQSPVPLSSALEACRVALAAYVESPDLPEIWEKLLASRREAASAIVLLSDGRQSAEELKPIIELQRKISASGAYDLAVDPADVALADHLLASGPLGLLAAMLLVPACQWPGAPAITSVPSGYWSVYTAYLFYTPQGFSAPGQVDIYGAHYLRRLEELNRQVGAGTPAQHVRNALAAFATINNSIPLYFSRESLRRHMELRGRLLQAHCRLDRRTDFPARSRAGRRLRVGFVNRHFASQTETYTTLPTFEQLDPERFEVQLFAHHNRDTVLDRYAQGRVEKFTLLPEGLAAQLKVLRSAELDVVVFGTNVTAVCHEVTQLALHRVAPLQVVNNSSCTTTGLPEIDLYVSGTATESAEAPAHFTERLGLLPGPAHAFNYEADKQPPARPWTRQDLGLTERTMLFVSAANFYKITPEMRETWARLLAAVPGARLLLHPFNPNWSSHYPIKRFCAEFDRVLEAHGVAPERLIVSSVKFPSRTDVGELLKLGDLYLDTFPFAGVNSLIDPLEHGVPVITREGDTFRSRMGAALLRSLGLKELVVQDDESYLALCTELAFEPEARQALRARVTAAMEKQPVFLDTLAASDNFGALLEIAHDELVTKGRAAFRQERQPILGPDMATVVRRHAQGRELLAAGKTVRAVDYLLGAIQQEPANAAIWCDLAAALHRNQRMDEAVQALQTCLRLDGRHLAGWNLLAELAESLGHAELLAEAKAMIQAITAPPASPAAGETRSKVLVYTDDPEHGGVAQYNHSLMVGLTVAGCAVTCAQSRSENPLVEAQRQLGVEHYWIPYDTKKEFARTLDDQASARGIFETVRPDLIVFSDCCPVSNMAARDVAMQMGIPYVVVVGFAGSYLADRFKHVLGRLALHYARARAVVAVSQENLELLRNRFGLPAEAGQVIHYGRPEQFFAPRDEAVRARLRAELKLPDEAVVCFTAARLASVKGYLYQIVAAKHLVALPGNEHLHFVWAGEGEQRAALEEAIITSGLTGRVHLLGHRWDVADWYDAADIFVLPSDLEGMPLAIMEAMAKGLPVVASAVSGIPEELGDTGQLLPSGVKNRSALINQLIRTLHLWTGNPTLRQTIGEAGRVRAEAMFRESLMIERTVSLIGRHVAEPAAAISA